MFNRFIIKFNSIFIYINYYSDPVDYFFPCGVPIIRLILYISSVGTCLRPRNFAYPYVLTTCMVFICGDRYYSGAAITRSYEKTNNQPPSWHKCLWTRAVMSCVCVCVCTLWFTAFSRVGVLRGNARWPRCICSIW